MAVLITEFLIMNIYFRYSENYAFGTVSGVDGTELEGVEVGLVKIENERLISKRVTDKSGLYRFVVAEGQYRVELTDERYDLVKCADGITFTNETKKAKVVSPDLVIKRKTESV